MNPSGHPESENPLAEDAPAEDAALRALFALTRPEAVIGGGGPGPEGGAADVLAAEVWAADVLAAEVGATEGADRIAGALAAGRAADDDPLRVLLAEVATDLAAVADEALVPISDDVRAALLERYAVDATVASVQPVGEPSRAEAPSPRVPRPQGGRRELQPSTLRSATLRSRTLRSRTLRSRTLRPRLHLPVPVRVAAVVLLALGVFLVASPPREAKAGLRLSGLDRLHLAEGRPLLGSARRLDLGVRVAPGKSERVALRFPGQGALLLDGEAAVEVVRLPQDANQVGLRLDAGRARIRCVSRPVPIAFDVPDSRGTGTLVLLNGEACARIDSDAGDETPAVWLPVGGEARWVGPDGTSTALLGPVHAVLGRDGVTILEDAEPRCRELTFFGPARTAVTVGRRVAARRWRVLEGRARRRGAFLNLSLPATLAWRPEGGASQARTLRLVLTAADDVSVALPAFGVDATSPATPVSSRPGSSPPASARPRRRVLTVALPPDWYETLGGGELELVFARPDAPGSAEEITFEGAIFLEESDDER